MKIEPSYRICKCLQSKNGGTKAPPYESIWYIVGEHSDMLPNKRSDIESNPTKMPQYAKTAPTKVSAVILKNLKDSVKPIISWSFSNTV